MDRVRVIGNSVVPQCVEALGRSIVAFEDIIGEKV
jgi:site-specific DNA-cytosine methylase